MSEDNRKDNEIKQIVERVEGEPTFAFVAASWTALFVGVISYLVGLYNAPEMQLNEKGYYFTVLMFGLYSVVSLQKAVRDKEEGLQITSIYYGISWFAVILSIGLMAIGLWNAGSLVRSEKGFYGIAFIESIFAAITIQKNIRDTARAREKAKLQ